MRSWRNVVSSPVPERAFWSIRILHHHGETASLRWLAPPLELWRKIVPFAAEALGNPLIGGKCRRSDDECHVASVSGPTPILAEAAGRAHARFRSALTYRRISCGTDSGRRRLRAPSSAMQAKRSYYGVLAAAAATAFSLQA